MKDLVAQVFRPYANSKFFYASKLTDFSTHTVRYILEDVDADNREGTDVNENDKNVESDEDLSCNSEEDMFANSDDDFFSPPRRRRKLSDGRVFVRSGVCTKLIVCCCKRA